MSKRQATRVNFRFFPMLSLPIFCLPSGLLSLICVVHAVFFSNGWLSSFAHSLLDLSGNITLPVLLFPLSTRNQFDSLEEETKNMKLLVMNVDLC